jgi:hypothetical protein
LFQDIAEEGLGVVEGGEEGVAGRFLEYAKERIGAMRDKRDRQAQALQAQTQQAQIQKLFDAPLEAGQALTRPKLAVLTGGRVKTEPTAEDWDDFEAWVNLQEPGN